MTTSLLKALININEYGRNALEASVGKADRKQPRVNLAGRPLDIFIKDSFCNSFSLPDEAKQKRYSEEFSYLGAQNNPPDMMIRGSDAVEVKKVNVGAPGLQFNSSYPKSKFASDSPLITRACRECEKGWVEKDIIYAVGYVKDESLRILIFVYGDCYAADKEHYEKIRGGIADGVSKLPLKFSKTKELARLNSVDPLGITSLRIRGMWIIKSPLAHFSEFIKPDASKNLSVFAIISAGKFDSFSKEEKNKVKQHFSVEDIELKNPNEPLEVLDAKLVSFSL